MEILIRNLCNKIYYDYFAKVKRTQNFEILCLLLGIVIRYSNKKVYQIKQEIIKYLVPN